VLRPGELLSDRYRLDAFLASGGMGEVWRATDVVLGRRVAVKLLLPAMLTDPGFAARFRAEARILAAFRHPNVVDVYDFGESTFDGRPAAYLVMAYVDGEPLSHRIATAGRLPVTDTLSVMAQAADALHAAHAGGVVHRDVKPGNLLVQEDGTVVLVDFGVARSAAITAITAADAVPGTVLYMAPEQVSGQAVSPATDIYALGAVGYQCLAGVPPFNGEAPMEIALRHLNDEVPPLPADLPEPARTLVMRSLAKDPADRYASAAALAAAARAAAAAVGGRVPGAATTTRLAGVPTAPLGPGTLGAVGAGAVGAGAAAAGAAALAAGAAPGMAGAASPTGTVVDLPPVGTSPVPPPPVDPFPYDEPPRRPPASRRRLAALMGAGAVLVAGAGLATLLALNTDGNTDPDGPTTPGGGTTAPATSGVTQPGAGPTGGNTRTTRGPSAPAQTPTASQPGPTATQQPEPTQQPTATEQPEPTGTGGGGGGDASDAPAGPP
jgi:eukaryotic-like serine/threonine-protein kinase